MNRSTAALFMATALLFAVICGGPLRGPGIAATLSAMAPSSSQHRLIYVSSIPYVGNPAILIYAGQGDNTSPFSVITSGLSTPRGLALDSAGDLYVANSTGGQGINKNGFVGVYAAGANSPSVLYGAGLSGVTDVLLGTDGRLYVAQTEGVVEFPKGSTTPDRAIYTGPGTTARGLALDPASNLVVTYDDARGHGHVELVPPGKTDGSVLALEIRRPVGAAFDSNGRLVLSDSSLGLAAVDIFAPPKRTPIQRITQKLILPQYLALDRQQSHVYVADSDVHAVFEFTYPSGTFVRKISAGLVRATGVAVFSPGSI